MKKDSPKRPAVQRHDLQALTGGTDMDMYMNRSAGTGERGNLNFEANPMLQSNKPNVAEVNSSGGGKLDLRDMRSSGSGGKSVFSRKKKEKESRSKLKKANKVLARRRG